MPIAWVWQLDAYIDEHHADVFTTATIKIGPPGASVVATAALADLNYLQELTGLLSFSHITSAFIDSYSTAEGNVPLDDSRVLIADNVVDITFGLYMVIPNGGTNASAYGSFLVLSFD